MASEIHVNDVGTRFLITVKEDSTVVDISGAESLSIFIRKPDDTLLARSGNLHTDGTDGKMYYDLASGDVNVAGHYKLQGRVSLSSSTYYTNVYNFQVHCNI
jgi:NAD/NADP transhydrogenase alpha subunit